MQNSERFNVTLERYNKKGSSDSFFFRIASAIDVISKKVLTTEDLGDAGAIGWNTNGFQGMQKHFETGSQAFAQIEIISSDETYVDRNTGLERERINFKLIVDTTEQMRAEMIKDALQSFKSQNDSAPRKVSRFAKLNASEKENAFEQDSSENDEQGTPNPKKVSIKQQVPVEN